MNIHIFPQPHILARLWQYQRERFPLLAHGLPIAAFSVSAISYSMLLRGQVAWPEAGAMLVALLSALLFFLQLRLADEFKDHEEDARYRPYRPVPRGLVSLPELAGVGAVTGLLQLGLAWWLAPALLPLLFLVWGFLALMNREFFVRDWLKARPFTYMWSHMLIVPLIDFYTTACDWLVAGATVPHAGLAWFLLVSFFNGTVIELGRKIRAPQCEEPGVESYTALWGRQKAMLAWGLALLLTAASAWQAARQIDAAGPVGWLLAGLLLVAGLVARRFLRDPQPGWAQAIETMSGVWTVLMYLSLGLLPLLARLLLAG